MKDLQRLLLIGLLLAGTAACDRATKHFAMTTLTGAPDQSFFSDTVRLTYHENPGAFLGVGAQWRPELRATFFQFGNGLFLLATAVLALRSRFSRLGQAGLALFLVALLGVAFINAQAFIWVTMGVPVAEGTYGAMFYAVTGAMTVMAVIGVTFGVITAFRYLGGRTRDVEVVSAHALYWYCFSFVYSMLWFVVYVTK